MTYANFSPAQVPFGLQPGLGKRPARWAYSIASPCTFIHPTRLPSTTQALTETRASHRG